MSSYTEAQINLLEARIKWLKTYNEMLDRDASFKDVVAFIVDNEEVSDRSLFLENLQELMDQNDDESIEESLANA